MYLRIILFSILLLISNNSFAQKISDLTEDTSPTPDDLTITVNDPNGTPANRKTTIANIFKGAGGIYVNGIGSNVGIGSPSPTTLLDVSGTIKASDITIGGALTSFGDSITVGYGLSSPTTQGYVYLFAQAKGWAITNRAVSGSLCPDQATYVMAESPTTSSIYSYADAINDMRIAGSNTAKQEDYRACLAGSLAWLGVPATQKITAQASSGVSTTGTWISTPVYGNGIGQSTKVAASTITFTTLPGKTVLLFGIIQNTNTSTFAVSIDGVTVASGLTESSTSSTESTVLFAPTVWRFPGLNFAPHTVVVTATAPDTTNYLHILGVAAVSDYTGRKSGPLVYVANSYRMNTAGYASTCSPLNCNNGSDTVVGQFDALIDKTVADLQNDGLNINLIDITNAQAYDPNATPTQVQGDNVHPNVLGNQNVANAFISQSTGFSLPRARVPAGQRALINSINNFTAKNTFATNVGIGSPIPTQLLDVAGTIRSSTGGIKFPDDTTQTTAATSLSGLTTNRVVKATSSSTVGNSQITDDGTNVGVNSTTPAAKLAISGDQFITGNIGVGVIPSGSYSIEVNPGSSSNAMISLKNSNTAAANGLTIFNSGNSNLTFTKFGSASSGSLAVSTAQGEIKSGSAFALYTTNSTNPLVFGTSTTERMRIDENGNTGIGTSTPSTLFEVGVKKFNVLSGGNVGVGSINPGQKLDVSGTVRATQGSFNDGTQGLLVQAYSGAGGFGAIYPFGVTPASANYYLALNSTQSILNNPVNDLFAIGGNEKARIDSNGNLGVGTAIPQAQLVVSGTSILSNIARFYSGVGDGSAVYSDFRTSAGSNLVISPPTAGGIFLGFDHGTGINFMCNGASACGDQFIASGNVGIGTIHGPFSFGGTTAPINNLEVAGNAMIGLGYAGVNTAPTDGLAVKGNVGIGTWNNTVALQITTTGGGTYQGVGGSNLVLENNSTSGVNFWMGGNSPYDGRLWSFLSSGSANTIVGGAGNFALIDRTAGIPRFLVDANGNIGIGTIFPISKLNVNAGSANGVTTLSSTHAVGSLLDIQNSSTGSAGMRFVNGSAGTGGWSMGADVTNNNAFTLGSGLNNIGPLTTKTMFTVAQTTGNVGVGTFFSNALLNVSSTANQDLFRVDDNGAGDSTPFIITSTGTVGIGTFSPSAFLDVRGNSSPTAAFRSNIVGGAFFGIKNSDANGTLIGDNWNFTAIGAAASVAAGATTEYMRIAAGGNIGIGTINTPYLMNVGAIAGEATSATDAIALTSQGRAVQYIASDLSNTVGEAGGAWTEYSQDGAVGTGSIMRVGTTQIINQDPSGATLTGAQVNASTISAINSSSLIQFGVGNSVVETITASNVGIGSLTPGQALDVQGTIRSTGGFNAGANCFYYCNGGVDVGVLSRGSGCLCPGGSCVATNICSN